MSILFITGAGVSAPSGIPTYRGNDDSLYNDEEHMNLMHIDSLGHPERRSKVKEHMKRWKDFISSKTPNKAHYLITEMIEKYSGIVVTQNVDNLHERSGLSNEDVFHLHGTLFGLDKEGYEGIPDVVLFGEDVKEETPNQWHKIKNTDVQVIVGTSLTVLSPFYYLNPDKPIYIININPKEVIETIECIFLDIPLDITVIENDVIEGLEEFKNIYLEKEFL